MQRFIKRDLRATTYKQNIVFFGKYFLWFTVNFSFSAFCYTGIFNLTVALFILFGFREKINQLSRELLFRDLLLFVQLNNKQSLFWHFLWSLETNLPPLSMGTQRKYLFHFERPDPAGSGTFICSMNCYEWVMFR